MNRAASQIATEAQIQIAMVGWLRIVLPPTAIVHHAKNEGNRGGRLGQMDGGKAQAMGVRPGAPDLMIFWQHDIYMIEVKAPGKNASRVQILFREDMAANGFHHWGIARSIDDARRLLQEFELPIRREKTAYQFPVIVPASLRQVL